MLKPRFAGLLVSLLPALAAGQSNVLTANYDNSRTNANLAETQLNPGSVSPASFGKLFTLSVDGQIYAQPLYMSNVPAAGSMHNILFVATMHNSLYAFDADTPGVPLWTVNFGPSIPATLFDQPGQPYDDIRNEIGILGTPVIDAATGTIYVVAGTLESGNIFYRLHALDVTNGVERFGGPVLISGAVTGIGDSSANGVVPFVGAQHLQRPGLALANGIVYVGFGSHGDAPPYHGWIFSYSAASVQNQVAVFTPTPNGSGGAFWQSGRAPAIDSAGNIFVASSNGDTDDTDNFSNSVLKLNSNTLALTDWFTPFNFQTLNDNDEDLGAMGPILLPNTGFVIGGGKQGVVYLLDQSSLGKLNGGDSQIPQEFTVATFPAIFNAAVWTRSGSATLYLHGVNAPFEAYSFNGAQFGAQPVSRSIASFNVPFQGMTISANGEQHGTGILWAITADSLPLPTTGTLRAWNADDLSSELWDSGMNSGDALGTFSKFANPTVVNGKVYVPTGSNQLIVYGLNASAAPVPVITAVTNAASYQAGPIAPGEILAIFGQNLGPQNLQMGNWSPADGLSEQAGGMEVTFNGIPAPVLYASSTTMAAIVPFEISGMNTASIQAGANGQMSAPQSVAVAATAPGIFSIDASGSGPGAILNTDYSTNSSANPAAAGSIVIVYGTGGGMTDEQNAAGRVASVASSLKAPVSATVGGQPAAVLYAGSAPGESNGVMQVNLQLPANVTGVQPVILTVGGVPSQATVTVAIQ